MALGFNPHFNHNSTAEAMGASSKDSTETAGSLAAETETAGSLASVPQYDTFVSSNPFAPTIDYSQYSSAPETAGSIASVETAGSIAFSGDGASISSGGDGGASFSGGGDFGGSGGGSSVSFTC